MNRILFILVVSEAKHLNFFLLPSEVIYRILIVKLFRICSARFNLLIRPATATNMVKSVGRSPLINC